MLLLLLSPFSRVRLCATPETAAHQAPLSLGFSRQEHWSGLPFPSQCRKVKSESEVTQSCPTLRDPMDCSLPGSSVHGIFQARVLEGVPLPSPYTCYFFSKHTYYITLQSVAGWIPWCRTIDAEKPHIQRINHKLYENFPLLGGLFKGQLYLFRSQSIG